MKDITMIDKWAELRKTLWANTEPSVELVGLTVPGAWDDYAFTLPCGSFVESWEIERQIAKAATVSTGVHVKDQDKLIRNLIKLGHHTPLESIQFNFHVAGISKACGAQLSRHRIGQGHVSSSRRYQEQGASFIYPLLDNIETEDVARQIYAVVQDSYRESYSLYLGLRKLGLKKGDSRYLIPTASSQERIWWVNARALRDFFRLRLDPTAESEIRRLAGMILTIAKQVTPVLFEDYNA